MNNLVNFKNLFLIDPLSVFFLMAIIAISAPSLLYSFGYLHGKYSPRRIIVGQLLTFIFILSMISVVTVKNVFIFLIAWEIMSLISYFLVLFDYEHEQSIKAGTFYIVMTHIGTAFLIAAFLIMYKCAGSFDFFAVKTACAAMPNQTKNLIFLFLLIGFGTKAGIVPLHIWLPYAHPQAPSHISSIMSGVMIKTAIYGILRFIVFTLGINSIWWGNLVLILASVSCLVGVIYALMEHDIKKLLAYHSVENIGIILLGIGAGMVFLKMNMPILAVFAFTAGIYHLINHTIFKGLLFLCSGSIYKSTGTRNIEKLGGLIKSMPWTAVSFLIGSMGISGLPPLNGFISEWLTFQVFFLGALNCIGGAKIFMGLCASVLALTSGLAAACFVKAFGITFLAMPRSQKAKLASESPFSMKFAMAFMALLTILFGLFAAVIIKLLVKVSGCITNIDTANMKFSINNFTLAPQSGNNVFLSSPVLALILAFLIGCLYLILRNKRTSINKTWDCGYYNLDSRTEYTATAFSKPFRIAFSFFLQPYHKTEKIRDSFYHVKYFRYEVFTTPVFRRYLYDPLIKMLFGTAKGIRKIQLGSIHIYIAYIFATLLLLIIFVSKF